MILKRVFIIAALIAMLFVVACEVDVTVKWSQITGRIIDSSSGEPIANASVYFMEGSEAADLKDGGNYTTTDSDGYFTADIEEGTYNVKVVKDGITYWGNQISLSKDLFAANYIPVSRALSEGEIRLVLRWEGYKVDADIHLTGPLTNNATDAVNRFHVYWNDMTNHGASIDIDDRNGVEYGNSTGDHNALDTTNGMETLTITNFAYAGVYKVMVHIYTNTSDSSGSYSDINARILVYDYTGLAYTIEAETTTKGQRYVWNVLTLTTSNENATNVYLEEVNTYSENPERSDSSFFFAPKK